MKKLVALCMSGGTSLFSQIRERLEKELVDLAPQAVKVKVWNGWKCTQIHVKIVVLGVVF